MGMNAVAERFALIHRAFAQASHEYDQGEALNFHEHFVADGHYMAPGGVDLKGRDAIADYFGNRDLRGILARHVVSNFAITEDGADSVKAFSLMAVLHDRDLDSGTLSLRMLLDVYDEWVRCENRWLLASREVVAHPVLQSHALANVAQR